MPTTGNVRHTFDGFISYSHAADGLLAPRLQAGLHRFAKPWWKRRAVRIFRDESSLSANPHLWSSITEALDKSAWFILLLSPEAAASAWVNQEIEYWREHRDPSRILPVVTDGEFGWDGTDVTGDAAPPALAGVFGEEPRWVDLRFARTEEQLDLKNPRFSSAVADVAAAVRGVPKDELESEEVRQHRRTTRMAWGAGLVVLVLGVVASVASWVAINQRNQARENAAISRSEALAASGIIALDTDPELSVLLGLQAYEAAVTSNAVSILHTGLQAHRTVASVTWDLAERSEYGFFFGAMSPDGELIAVTGARDEIEMWSADDSSGPTWRLRLPVEGASARFTTFTSDSESLIVAVAWLPGLNDDARSSAPPGEQYGIYGFDVETGDQQFVIDLGPCGAMAFFTQFGFVDPGVEFLVLGKATADAGGCDQSMAIGHLVEIESKTSREAYRSEEGWDSPLSTWTYSPERDLIAGGTGQGAVIFDVKTGRETKRFDGPIATWVPGGDLLLVGGDPLKLVEYDSGRVLHEFPGLYWGQIFTRDGRFMLANEFSGATVMFDLHSGEAVTRLMSGDAPLGISVSEGGDRIGTFGQRARLWNVETMLSEGLRVPLGTGAEYRVAANLDVGAGRAVTWQWNLETNLRQTTVFDITTGQMLLSRSGWAGDLSEDGALVAYQSIDSVDDEHQEVGTVVIEPVDGFSPSLALQGLCTWRESAEPQFLAKDYANGEPLDGSRCSGQGIADWADDLEFSPDGTMIAMAGRLSSRIWVWDTSTGRLLHRAEFPPMSGDLPTAVAWHPDGHWLAYSHAALGIVIIETATWNVLSEIDIQQPLYDLEFSPAGQLLVGGNQTQQMVIFDTETWSELDPVHATEGEGVRDIAISPDSSMAVTVGDQFIRAWDLETRARLFEVVFAQEIRGIAFGSPERLLITPRIGDTALEILLEPSELATVALERLTRTFTQQECQTYRIEPCPTLDEMRGG